MPRDKYERRRRDYTATVTDMILTAFAVIAFAAVFYVVYRVIFGEW